MKPDGWTSDEWSTPPAFVEAMAAEFGPFDLDVCCRPETAKAARFYTKADDGLSRPWVGRVWLNPPYSKPRPWLEKAASEVAAGRATVVVALLPASVDTRWFHEAVLGRAELRFVRGRVRFHGWDNTPIPSPKTPNIVAVFRSSLPSSGVDA